MERVFEASLGVPQYCSAFPRKYSNAESWPLSNCSISCTVDRRDMRRPDICRAGSTVGARQYLKDLTDP